jgi:hypothetical protein
VMMARTWIMGAMLRDEGTRDEYFFIPELNSPQSIGFRLMIRARKGGP